MKARDAFGRIPANPYGRAKSQVDLMKWGGAARRVEQAAAPPVAPEMFSARAPASAAGAPLISPTVVAVARPGNVGGRIRSIVVHPNKPDTLFAGSVGGGIWKTTNGGASWTPVDDFMAVLSVSSLVINPANPSVMFAGTGEGYGNADSLRGAGIFKSVDGGTTWTQLPGTAEQSSRGHPSGHFPERHGRCWRAPTLASGAARTRARFTWIDAARHASGCRHPSVRRPEGRRGRLRSDRLFVGRRPHLAALDRAAVDLGPHRARVRAEPARHDLRARRRRRRHALPERRRRRDVLCGVRHPSAGQRAGLVRRSAVGESARQPTTLSPAECICARPSTAARPGDGSATTSTSISTSIVEDPRYDDAGNRTVFIGNDGGVYKTDEHPATSRRSATRR